MAKCVIFSVIIIFSFLKVQSQECYSIDDIALSFKNQSIPISNAKYRLASKQLNSEIFFSQFKWQSKVGLELPYINNIQSIIQNDGTIKFLPRQFLNPEIRLTTSKQILATGGEIGITNSIGLISNLKVGDRQFNANWVNVYLNQPLFKFNELKYSKQLQYLNNTGDTIQFLLEREQKLFEFLQKFATYKKTLANIDLINQRIAQLRQLQEKIKLQALSGKLLFIDTLTSQLNIDQLVLEQRKAIDQRNVLQQQLSFFVSIDLLENLCNDIEYNIYSFESDIIKEKFKQTNYRKELVLDSFIITQGILKAKVNNGITTNISAGVGYNQSANVFNSIFQNPSSTQNVSISAGIPITNWRNWERNKQISQLTLLEHKNRLQEIDAESNIWCKEALNKYYYLFEEIKLSQKSIEQLKEVERIQQLKYESGRLPINELIATQMQITDFMNKLNETKLQVLIFRYEIRSKTLYDIKELNVLGF
jgi:hypothetical protein